MPTHRPATLGPTRVFVIRHGEKPDAPGKQTRHATPAADAIDEQGRTNPHSLIPRGWQRAGGLTALFAPADGVHREGLATPSLLLAPDRGPAGSAAHRTTQTISPLAGRLGLPVATPYPSGKEHHLISEHVLTAADACVLICWDHENIGALLQALATTTEIAPARVLPASGWPDDRYDVILAFARRPGPGGGYDYTQIPQMLLAGDSAMPLAGG